MIKNLFWMIYRALKGQKYSTQRLKRNKSRITRVYFIFPNTFAISVPLKSMFNSCLVVLEPLTYNTADLNKLKDNFGLSR